MTPSQKSTILGFIISVILTIVIATINIPELEYVAYGFIAYFFVLNTAVAYSYMEYVESYDKILVASIDVTRELKDCNHDLVEQNTRLLERLQEYQDFRDLVAELYKEINTFLDASDTSEAKEKLEDANARIHNKLISTNTNIPHENSVCS